MADSPNRVGKTRHCPRHCPECGTVLQPTDHQTVIIDRCRDCEGIWLDRGELQKILELRDDKIKKLLALFG